MADPTRVNILRVRAAREGGAVRHCHVFPGVSPYSVAAHSYGAVSLLLILHPNPSRKLVMSLLWHDVAERWLGDIPHLAKENADLREVYERIEEEHLTALGMHFDLDGTERHWVSCLDTFELWMWSTEEYAQTGNQYLVPMIEACEAALRGRYTMEQMPDELKDFYRLVMDDRTSMGRLSDRFATVRNAIEAYGGSRPPHRRLEGW